MGEKGAERAAGIYGTVITAAILDTLGGHTTTGRLVLAVLVTLLVYWAAEQYARLLGEHTENGHLPRWPTVRASLAATWPMVASSFLPLVLLVVVRVAGASDAAAATVALLATVLLLVVYACASGRAGGLRGKSLLGATLMAAGLGVVVILLKELLLLHLH
jgi:hypothetical protein